MSALFPRSLILTTSHAINEFYLHGSDTDTLIYFRQLIIHKLQDADFNDLDLEYTVGDVFSDKAKDKCSSVVRVIRLSQHRQSSIPPESGLRPQRKHGRQQASVHGRDDSRVNHSFISEDEIEESISDMGAEAFEGISRERARKRLKVGLRDLRNFKYRHNPN